MSIPKSRSLPSIQRFEQHQLRMGASNLLTCHRHFYQRTCELDGLLFGGVWNPERIGQPLNILALDILRVIDDGFEQPGTQIGIHPPKDK